MKLSIKPLLCLLTVVSAACLATAPAGPVPLQPSHKMMWRLQLLLPNRPDFSIGVQQLGSDVKPFGILPLENASMSALKVVGQEQSTDILVTLYAVKNYKKGMKCAELKALAIQPLGSFLAPKNKPVEIASLSPYGISNLHLAAYLAEELGAKCCSCDGIHCCPNPGACFDDCNGCGMCCNTM